jgi:hypothetical protein
MAIGGAADHSITFEDEAPRIAALRYVMGSA